MEILSHPLVQWGLLILVGSIVLWWVITIRQNRESELNTEDMVKDCEYFSVPKVQPDAELEGEQAASLGEFVDNGRRM